MVIYYDSWTCEYDRIAGPDWLVLVATDYESRYVFVSID